MRNLVKLTSLTVSACVLGLTANFAAAQNASTLSDLLDLVENDRIAESAEYQQRQQEFEQNANRQQQILRTTNQRISEQEAEQSRLSDQFEANEIIIRDKRDILRDRRGDLNELFGTLQGVAGDFLSNFENSLISAQYPGRSEYLEGFIEKAGSTIEQLNPEEIERFWFYMQQEVVESARVVSYNGDIALPAGDRVNRSIVRIGNFNAISEGEYLSYNGDIGHLQVLPRQPDNYLLRAASSLENSDGGFTQVGIDPTGGVGGQVMANLVNFPSVEEQVRNNSGTIGFIIIGVGVIGILIGFLRLLILSLVSIKVRGQLKSDKPSSNNPLGRVLLVAESNPTADTETLELKLGEAILQETPSLESHADSYQDDCNHSAVGRLAWYSYRYDSSVPANYRLRCGRPNNHGGWYFIGLDDHCIRYCCGDSHYLYAHGSQESFRQHHPYPGRTGDWNDCTES